MNDIDYLRIRYSEFTKTNDKNLADTIENLLQKEIDLSKEYISPRTKSIPCQQQSIWNVPVSTLELPERFIVLYDDRIKFHIFNMNL